MAKKIDKITEYVNVMRRADIFYDLTESQLEMIAALCSEATPQAGESIFEENSTSDEMYIITKGKVDILVSPALIQSTATGETSRPLTIITLGRGQTFGEIALVDQGLRSASARCASKNTHLLIIPRDRLIKLCDDNLNLVSTVLSRIFSTSPARLSLRSLYLPIWTAVSTIS